MSAAQTLIVFGRGGTSGAARVHATVDYVRRHRATRPLVIFTGGWSEVAEGEPEPPDGYREADLMAGLARAAGLHRYADLAVESRSRSTLENLANVVADGLLAGRDFDRERPLGLVSHAWHLPRIRFLAGRVLGLRGSALLDVPVTAGDLAAVGTPPGALLLAARLGYLGARDTAMLLRRERLLAQMMARWRRRRV